MRAHPKAVAVAAPIAVAVPIPSPIPVPAQNRGTLRPATVSGGCLAKLGLVATDFGLAPVNELALN